MKVLTFKYQFLGFFCLFFSLISCSKKTTIVTKSKIDSLQKAISNESQILFIQLKINQNDEDASITANILNKKLVNGFLDKPLQGIVLIEGSWLISFLDAEQKILAQEVVKDPINQHFEYTNEKGKLDNVTVVKKETDCFVRVQFSPQFHYLKCEAILTQKKLKTFFQIKI